MDDNTNNLMNTTMYDALTNAGAKEKDARAAAIEAGKNNLHSMNLEHKLTETRSYVNSSLTEAYSRVDTSLAKVENAMVKLRSSMDKSVGELRSHTETGLAEVRGEIARLNSEIAKLNSRMEAAISRMETTIAEGNQRITNTLLIGIGVAATAVTGVLSILITVVAIFA